MQFTRVMALVAMSTAGLAFLFDVEANGDDGNSQPLQWAYSGLLQSGESDEWPGQKKLSFALYRQAAGGDALWYETHGDVDVSEIGAYRVVLGSVSPLLENGKPIDFGGTLWLQVTVDEQPAQRRIPITPVPHSRGADNAARLQGRDWLDVRALLPVGVVLPFAGNCGAEATRESLAAQGYLVCDGAAVSRKEYSNLYATLGVSHGEGDGETTFNLPDYRGRFLRGVDGGAGNDPDVGNRKAMADGGNANDQVGSIQGDAVSAHEHTVGENGSHTHSASGGKHAHQTDEKGEHNHGVDAFDNLLKYDRKGTAKEMDDFHHPGKREPNLRFSEPMAAKGAHRHKIPKSGSHSHNISGGGHSHSVTGGGGSETRPKNAYVYYIIKCR